MAPSPSYYSEQIGAIDRCFIDAPVTLPEGLRNSLEELHDRSRRSMPPIPASIHRGRARWAEHNPSGLPPSDFFCVGAPLPAAFERALEAWVGAPIEMSFLFDTGPRSSHWRHCEPQILKLNFAVRAPGYVSFHDDDGAEIDRHAGAAVLFNPRVWHTIVNPSDEIRTTLTVIFAIPPGVTFSDACRSAMSRSFDAN